MLTTSTMLASISGRTAGRMWRRRMWTSPAPTALARMTYLRSRTESVCDRTSRAVAGPAEDADHEDDRPQRRAEDRDEHDHAAPGPG